MGYSGEMYRLAWESLLKNFDRTQKIVKAQLKQIHAHQFIKPHDSQAIIKYSQTISNCVNVLTQYHCVGDLTSESVLISAVRKFPPEIRSKWFFHTANSGIATAVLKYFSMWLNNVAFVYNEMSMQFSSDKYNDKRPAQNKEENKKPSTSALVSQNSPANIHSQNADSCLLNDGIHKLWNCPKLESGNVAERYETVKKLRFCFRCPDGKDLIKNCKSDTACGVNASTKTNNRLVHQTTESKQTPKESEINASTNITQMDKSGL